MIRWHFDENYNEIMGATASVQLLISPVAYEWFVSEFNRMAEKRFKKDASHGIELDEATVVFSEKYGYYLLTWHSVDFKFTHPGVDIMRGLLHVLIRNVQEDEENEEVLANNYFKMICIGEKCNSLYSLTNDYDNRYTSRCCVSLDFGFDY